MTRTTTLLLLTLTLGCSGKDADTGGGSEGSDGTDGGDGGDGSDGSDGGDGGTTGDACDDSTLAADDVCASWMLNTSESAAVISTDGTMPLVNVQSATVSTDGDRDYVTIASMGIPNYSITFSQDDIDTLNARPLATTDFKTGAPTVAAGDSVNFGDDIGFDSTGCERDGIDEGAGFWPPGPECPEATEKSMTIPAVVTESTDSCYTPIGTAGLYVNGVSLFNWTDGFSYESAGDWYNLAQKFEIYDVSVCAGHAAGGEYHHHSAAPCLGDQLDDDGSGHSPIYAWAADGVPMHGPYVAADTLAQSCWIARDYDTDNDLGCGGTGERSCVLVDPFDPTSGTVAAGSDGPNTSDVVTSLSGNVFTAVSGFYFEDHYYDADCTALGTEYMDEHNGHDHDGLGYHYHMTSTFPYTVGPTYYGVLEDNAMVTCQSTPYSEMGGGPPPSAD